MTRPQADHHKRERPGGELGYDVEDLDALVANCVAVGPAEARRMIDPDAGGDAEADGAGGGGTLVTD